MSDSQVALLPISSQGSDSSEPIGEWWQELGLHEAPAEFVKTQVSFDSQKLQQILELLSKMLCTVLVLCHPYDCCEQVNDNTRHSKHSNYFKRR